MHVFKGTIAALQLTSSAASPVSSMLSSPEIRTLGCYMKGIIAGEDHFDIRSTIHMASGVMPCDGQRMMI